MTNPFPTAVVPRRIQITSTPKVHPEGRKGVLVGLSGLPRAGKDTAALFLIRHCDFNRVAFADPLRQFVYSLIDVPRGIDPDSIKDDELPELGGKTPRQAMQTLGTEWGRTHIDKDLWLNVAKRKVQKLLDAGVNVVVTDVRFDNEAEMVRQLGGKVIRVSRPDHEITTSTHVAEAGISPHLIDHVVLNDTTREGLGCRVAGLVL